MITRLLGSNPSVISQNKNVIDMITPNKEFFQWIYNRLVYVHNENPDVDYMRSFKERIEELSFDKPHWKPSEEQMAALKYVTKKWEDGQGVACPSSFKYHAITELYEQLKKLM